MTIRQLLCAWLLAAALVAGGSAAILGFAPKEPNPFEGQEIAVIGSSLTQFAVPAQDDGTNFLLGDGRGHRRKATNSVSEPETLAFAESALAADVDVLFIEVNQLIAAFDNHPIQRSCDNFGTRIRTELLIPRRLIASRLKLLIGWDSSGKQADQPARLERDQIIDRDLIAEIYPLHLRDPSCLTELATIVDRARAQDTNVVFVLFPRSEAGDEYIDASFGALQRHRAQDLADELGASLFAPQGPWPNSHFIDQAHMNFRGRAQFLDQLRAWWQSQ